MKTALLLKDLQSELSFKTSRSGGAGGQNVNKVSTKVEINFDIAASNILTAEQKAVLLEKLASQLTKEGMLQIVSQTERTQLGNKTKVIEKFYKILEKAFFVPKKRKPTKPSKSSKEKRLISKKKHSEIKKMRNKRIE
jgi:ribosome-associated protein